MLISHNVFWVGLLVLINGRNNRFLQFAKNGHEEVELFCNKNYLINYKTILGFFRKYVLITNIDYQYTLFGARHDF